jgi:hypothetical protein
MNLLTPTPTVRRTSTTTAESHKMDLWQTDLVLMVLFFHLDLVTAIFTVTTEISQNVRSVHHHQV